MKKISPIVITAIPMVLIGGAYSFFTITFMEGYKGITYMDNALRIWPVLVLLVVLVGLIFYHYLVIKKKLDGRAYWIMEIILTILILMSVLLIFQPYNS